MIPNTAVAVESGACAYDEAKKVDTEFNYAMSIKRQRANTMSKNNSNEKSTRRSDDHSPKLPRHAHDDLERHSTMKSCKIYLKSKHNHNFEPLDDENHGHAKPLILNPNILKDVQDNSPTLPKGNSSANLLIHESNRDINFKKYAQGSSQSGLGRTSSGVFHPVFGSGVGGNGNGPTNPSSAPPGKLSLVRNQEKYFWHNLEQSLVINTWHTKKPKVYYQHLAETSFKVGLFKIKPKVNIDVIEGYLFLEEVDMELTLHKVRASWNFFLHKMICYGLILGPLVMFISLLTFKISSVYQHWYFVFIPYTILLVCLPLYLFKVTYSRYLFSTQYERLKKNETLPYVKISFDQKTKKVAKTMTITKQEAESIQVGFVDPSTLTSSELARQSQRIFRKNTNSHLARLEQEDQDSPTNMVRCNSVLGCYKTSTVMSSRGRRRASVKVAEERSEPFARQLSDEDKDRRLMMTIKSKK